MPPRAPPPPPDVFFTISTRVCALGGHVVRAESAPGSFALRFILDHWLSGAMLHVELRGAALRITKVDEFGSTEPAKTSDVDAEDDIKRVNIRIAKGVDWQPYRPQHPKALTLRGYGRVLGVERRCRAHAAGAAAASRARRHRRRRRQRAAVGAAVAAAAAAAAAAVAAAVAAAAVGAAASRAWCWSLCRYP